MSYLKHAMTTPDRMTLVLLPSYYEAKRDLDHYRNDVMKFGLTVSEPDLVINFAEGGCLKFGICRGPEDLLRYVGYEIHHLFVDKLPIALRHVAFRQLVSRMR